jgi:hypothetical protein
MGRTRRVQCTCDRQLPFANLGCRITSPHPGIVPTSGRCLRLLRRSSGRGCRGAESDHCFYCIGAAEESGTISMPLDRPAISQVHQPFSSTARNPPFFDIEVAARPLFVAVSHTFYDTRISCHQCHTYLENRVCFSSAWLVGENRRIP